MILVAGLTPAWQRTLAFEKFRLGEVNRAQSSALCGSGKVLNVGRAVATLLRSSNQVDQCVTLVPLGGVSRPSIAAEFVKDEIPLQILECQATTRTCTTLIDSHSSQSTELVENAAALSTEELARYDSQFHTLAARASVAVLTGSLPAQTPSDYYSRLLRGFTGRAILDVRGPELLTTMEHRPWLVKPNLQELTATLKAELNSLNDVISAMKKLQSMGAENVLITHGASEVLLLTSSGLTRFVPPKIAKVVNPIGCGDSLAGGIAWATFRGLELIDAVRWGISAAAANVEEFLPARFRFERVQELYGEIQHATVEQAVAL